MDRPYAEVFLKHGVALLSQGGDGPWRQATVTPRSQEKVTAAVGRDEQGTQKDIQNHITQELTPATILFVNGKATRRG